MAIKKLGITNLGITIQFEIEVERNLYDIGALRLSCEGREYVYDVSKSYSGTIDNSTYITCDLEVDEEVFPKGDEYPYDLNEDDLFNPNLKATLYIGDDYEEVPQSIIFGFTQNGCTKIINVEIE